VLLRQLNRVFKVLAQTVPDTAKNDTVRELEVYLQSMIRQVDSSLLEEWEKMRDPGWTPPAAAPGADPKELRPPGADEALADITRDAKSFTALVRQQIFAFLRGLVNREPEQALSQLSATDDLEGGQWTPERLMQCVERFESEHERLCLDPEARNVRHTYVKVSEDRKTWRVDQVLVDPAGDNDWVAVFEVDLAASRAARATNLRLRHMGPLTMESSA
jgi:hypothetical protein